MTTHVALIIPEGVQTSDKRFFEEGSLSWRDPMPLMGQDKTTPGHDGATFVGNITNISRATIDGVTWIVGDVAYASDETASRFQTLANDEQITGISADYAVQSAEIEITQTDEQGNPTDGREVVLDAEIIGATQLPMPAFAGAKIVTAQAFAEMTTEAVTAALNPAAEASWFDNPELDAPTPLTVTDDGRVFGHLALWGTCHIGFDGCVTPPQEQDYSYFNLGAVQVDGKEVEVGHITIGTGHAKLSASSKGAVEHYDNTGTVAADIRAGADEHGIWVAGAARPDTDIDALRAASLSGDWRRVDGELRLVAALAVNVPGFPIPRPAARVASGEQESLVASGLVKHPNMGPTLLRATKEEMARVQVVPDLQLVAAALGKISDKLDRIIPTNPDRQLLEIQKRELDHALRTGKIAALVAAAIPSHNTAVTEENPGGNTVMTRATSASDYRAITAWYSGENPDQRGSYKFPHHVSPGGAASLPLVRNGLARLPQANIPEGDRAGVERHLRNHLNAQDQSAAVESVGHLAAILDGSTS